MTLYSTSSGPTAISGTIYAFTDTTGYDGTVSGTASVLASAITNEAFRGVAMAPDGCCQSTPLPRCWI